MGMGTAAAPGIGQVLWPALAMMGSQALASLLSPTPQQLQTFEGNTTNDPNALMSETRSQLNDMISTLKGRANQPVQLRSSYVQQPPVFTGGGLPMPIGVVGMDPALADKSLLRLPGMTGANVDPVPRDNRPPREPDNPTDPDVNGPLDTSTPTNDPVNRALSLSRAISGRSGTNTPMRRSIGGGQSLFTNTSAMPNVSQYDDLSRGAGAVELLLRSAGGLV